MMYEYHREKLYVNHFCELKGYIVICLGIQRVKYVEQLIRGKKKITPKRYEIGSWQVKIKA